MSIVCVWIVSSKWLFWVHIIARAFFLLGASQAPSHVLFVRFPRCYWYPCKWFGQVKGFVWNCGFIQDILTMVILIKPRDGWRLMWFFVTLQWKISEVHPPTRGFVFTSRWLRVKETIAFPFTAILLCRGEKLRLKIPLWTSEVLKVPLFLSQTTLFRIFLEVCMKHCKSTWQH